MQTVIPDNPTTPVSAPEPVTASSAESQVLLNKAAERTGRARVVVVGAGFGGLNALSQLKDSEVDLLVIDRNNYHGFWPLLYQVATAGLEPESIAYPVRALLRKNPNAHFRLAEVTGLDLEKRQVLTDGQPVPYDYLILAAGSINNYFGNDALAHETFGMKDVDDAEALRNHVLTCFERATNARDSQEVARLMTFVIIGGGPTGVELAGAFSELVRHVMHKDFPTLNLDLARVVLIEADASVLSTFPENLQRSALRRLRRMGVELMLNHKVTSVKDDVVTLDDGSHFDASTVVWAAGVRASKIGDDAGLEQARGGRIKVTPQLNVAAHPEIFVIGDMAYLEGFKPGVAYPMVAQVAIQMGKLAAKNILAELRGQPMQEFKYFDFGSMATIGRSAAVFDAFGIRLSGWLAWMGWLFVHILYLIGFRNRVLVLANWVINYFTYERGVRIISHQLKKDEG